MVYCLEILCELVRLVYAHDMADMQNHTINIDIG